MRKYRVEEAFENGNKVAVATSVLIGAAVALAVGTILVKLLWTWTIPDLFPGAVEQGLIAANITLLSAMKTVALVAILSSIGSLLAGRLGR